MTSIFESFSLIIIWWCLFLPISTYLLLSDWKTHSWQFFPVPMTIGIVQCHLSSLLIWALTHSICGQPTECVVATSIDTAVFVSLHYMWWLLSLIKQFQTLQVHSYRPYFSPHIKVVWGVKLPDKNWTHSYSHWTEITVKNGFFQSDKSKIGRDCKKRHHKW